MRRLLVRVVLVGGALVACSKHDPPKPTPIADTPEIVPSAEPTASFAAVAPAPVPTIDEASTPATEGFPPSAKKLAATYFVRDLANAGASLIVAADQGIVDVPKDGKPPRVLAAVAKGEHAARVVVTQGFAVYAVEPTVDYSKGTPAHYAPGRLEAIALGSSAGTKPKVLIDDLPVLKYQLGVTADALVVWRSASSELTGEPSEATLRAPPDFAPRSVQKFDAYLRGRSWQPLTFAAGADWIAWSETERRDGDPGKEPVTRLQLRATGADAGAPRTYAMPQNTMDSRPLVEAANVYFMAQQRVMRLDVATGTATALTPKLDRVTFLPLVGNDRDVCVVQRSFVLAVAKNGDRPVRRLAQGVTSPKCAGADATSFYVTSAGSDGVRVLPVR